LSSGTPLDHLRNCNASGAPLHLDAQRIGNHLLFRANQIAMDIMSHAAVARITTKKAPGAGSSRHKITANTSRPMQPADAPAESTLAASRPCLVPSRPAFAIFRFSWA